MKKQFLHFFLIISFVLIISLTGFAQAPPQAISYQAVARDVNGNVLSNKTVSLRFSIHDATSAGTIVYQETQTATTNVLGLVNLSIGINGTVITGTFAGINWGSGPKYLEVEIDPTGGSTYTSLGTSQMLSVPYALYAGNGGGGGTTGQDVVEVDGTGSLTINNATAFTLIPGLTTTVNVPANSKILIQTTGGISNTSGPSTWIIVDIALYVDGAYINGGTPAYKRINIINPTLLNGSFGQWTVNSAVTLTPGPHTIEVKAAYAQSSSGGNTATVSDVSGYVNQGQLIVTTIKQ